MKQLVISILFKGWSGNKNLYSYILFLLYLTPIPLIFFTTEEITDCNTEKAKYGNKTPRNPRSCFFTLCFTVSVTLSIDTPKYFNDFMILILSFIPSFEINKVNPFHALTAPFSLIFDSNLLIAFEVKLLTIPGKLFLTKGIATFVSAFFPKLDNQQQKDLPD